MKRLLRQLQPRHYVYYGILLAIIIALIAFLRKADLPWEKGVEAKTSKGQNPGTQHFVVSGLYYGAWIDLGVCGFLALLGYWALQPLKKSSAAIREAVSDHWSWPTVAAMILAAVSTIILLASTFHSRMDQSLWGDEEYTMKRFTVGDFERDEQDSLQFKPVKWRDTLFWYKNPNNHIFYSILARSSHETFGPGEEIAPEQFHFSERALRIPAMLAGVGALASLVWLLILLGLPKVAWFMPLLLVLHPWFVRYAVEARGYSLVLFLVPLGLCMAIRCLRTGAWPWWTGYALTQSLLFYSHPATLYFLLFLNGAVAGAILFSGRRHRIHQGARWICSCLFSALPVVFLMAPLKIPLEMYLDRGRAKGELTPEWYQDIGSYLISGTSWNEWEPDNPLCIGLSSASPWLVWPMIFLFSALTILGALYFFRRGGWHRWILVALVLPPFAMLAVALKGGNYLYPWYMVIYLPGVFVLVAAGLEFVARCSGKRGAVPCFVFSLLLLFFVIVPRPQRLVLLEHPTEPIAEAVRATRTIVNPHDSRIDRVITVGFHMAATGYDPAIRVLTDDNGEEAEPLQQLQALMEDSDSSKRPLFVHFAQYPLAKKRFPQVVEVLENSQLFSPQQTFYGQDTQLTRLVYEYRGRR